MKQKSRQWAYGVLAGTFLLTALSGCQKKMTAETLLAQMAEKSETVEMSQADWTMGVDVAVTMDILGADTEMNVGVDAEGTTKTNLTDEVSYTTAALTADLFGTETSQEMEIYTQVSDGQMAAYLGIDGDWVKSSAETDTDTVNVLSAVSDLGGSLSLADGTTDRDGASCYELTCELTGEQMLSLFEKLTASQDVSSELFSGENALLDEEEVLGLLQTKLTLYVDAETFLPAEMVIEAAESEDTAESETADGESVSAEVSVSSFAITAKLTYPETETITIPEEALAAPEESEDSDNSLLGDTDEADLLENSDADADIFENLSNPVVVKDYGETGETLHDQDGITVAVRRVYTDGDDSAYIDLILTNGSEESLDFYTLGVCLNDTMAESSLYQTVAAGETAACTVYAPDLASQGISEIGRVRMDLVADGTEDYERKLEAVELSFEISETGEDSVMQDGGARLIYEDDQIAVTAYDEIDEENSGYHTMPICIENKTDQKIAVSADGLRVGDQEIGAALYGEMFPHTLYYTSILVDADSMLEAGITDFQGVEFTLSATEVENPANVIFSVDVAAYPEV